MLPGRRSSRWKLLAVTLVATQLTACAPSKTAGRSDLSSCAASGIATYDNSFGKICAVLADGTSNAQVFKNEVNFVVVCKPTNRANDDPILLPGASNEGRFMHEHRFIGTVGSATSEADALLSTTTNCSVSDNHSLYWSPTLFKSDGTPMVPYTSRLYYRAGTMHPEDLVAMPNGLEMIAGDSMATESRQQRPGVAGIYCRTIGQHEGGQTAKQSFPPGSAGSAPCSTGTVIAESVVFPNCWNGVVKYAPENFAYSARDGTCPSGLHNIPQLTQENRYDEDGRHSGEANMYFSSMSSPFTLHADVIEAWHGATFQRLLDDCLKASVHCGDVSDARMPVDA